MAKSLARVRIAGPLVAVAVLLAACGSSSSSESSAAPESSAPAAESSAAPEPSDATSASPESEGGEAYDIYSSINFAGNDFRNDMIKASEILVEYPPQQGRVNLTNVVAPENSVTSQIQSLQQIIAEDPDAIVLTAASPTGLDPTLNEACDKGITVVSFEGSVGAKCAWTVNVDLELIGKAWAQWMVKTLGGEGKVFLDQGIAGDALSKTFGDAFKAEVAANPGIEIVCEFEGKNTYANEKQGISRCLAAHPDVDGMLIFGTAVSGPDALEDAGIDRKIAFTGGAYNNAAMACQEKGHECLLAEYPFWLQSLAINKAIEIMDGKLGSEPQVISEAFPFIQSNIDEVTVDLPNFVPEPLEEGKTYFPDQPPTLILPVAPPWAPEATDAILAALKD